MRIASSLFAVGLLAAAPATPPPAGGAAAVNQSTLQTFTPEGYRHMLLRATTMKVTRERVDMTGMNLSIFTGDAAERIDKILLSPEATLLTDENVAQGDKSVRLILGDELEATGTKWVYRDKEKRISLDGNVRVLFRARLQDILK
jgi:hypothetical protein